MRSRICALVLTLMTAVLAGAAVPVATAAPTSPPSAEEQFLFTLEATRGATVTRKGPAHVDEMFTLRLSDIGQITRFADRPFRDADVITPRQLVAGWPIWFAESAPNAVLSYSTGPRKRPQSIVVMLNNPRVSGNTITFSAVRIYRKHDPAVAGTWKRPTTPKTFTQASLFIDDAAPTETTAIGRTDLSWGATTLTYSGGDSVTATCGSATPTVIPFGGDQVPVPCAGGNELYPSISSSWTFLSAYKTDLNTIEYAGIWTDQFGNGWGYGNGYWTIPPTLNWCTLVPGTACNGVNLSEQGLEGIDISGGSFIGANFSEAMLISANLSNANLSNANLNEAFLGGRMSLMTGGIVSGANLRGANLTGANLDGAFLGTQDPFEGPFGSGPGATGVDLTGAIGADLSGAFTDSTTTCPDGNPGPC